MGHKKGPMRTRKASNPYKEPFLYQKCPEKTKFIPNTWMLLQFWSDANTEMSIKDKLISNVLYFHGQILFHRIDSSIFFSLNINWFGCDRNTKNIFFSIWVFVVVWVYEVREREQNSIQVHGNIIGKQQVEGERERTQILYIIAL